MDLQSTRQVAERQGRPLTSEQEAQLRAFGEELYRRNAVMNLTRVSEEDCDVRHFADSLLVSEFCAEGAEVLDIGPGPGFPSWVLACCRPDLLVTAIESQGKMLRMLSALPLPNLKIWEQRAEEEVLRERFDMVTGRAVAPIAVQAEISAAWLKVGGVFVPFRTPSEQEAIESLNLGVLGLKLWGFEERKLPGADAMRLFPVFEKVAKTQEAYPRIWGKIKARPLGS